jgi:DNA-binding Lrp family transcriptional regulator
MLTDNEMKIISHLRQNSRQSLIEIARKTDIPLSTIYDKIKGHEGSTIKKFTSIVDFPAIGFSIRAAVFAKGKQKKLNEFLMRSQNINSLFRLGGNYEYYADCIFRYMNEMNDFMERLEELSDKKEVYFVTQELRREDFLNPIKIEKTNTEGK